MTDGRIVRGQVVAGRVAGFSPWEDEFGYSRAVAAGDHVHVAGTTAWVDGHIEHEGDPYRQTLAAFGVGLKALAAYGLTADDVVRTRMYITHVRDADEVGRAHRELFDAARPVATMVVVEGLIDSRMMVEVELDAYRSGLAKTLEAPEGKQP
ncbi:MULTISPECIES: RidA family protein [Streptomyces]|uniref:RidA family protein n=1 Tax=Streptomyces TaxID=1883 RepID=UPI00068E6494|nr:MULTISPECIES: RidA family protein [Streptomyces]